MSDLSTIAIELSWPPFPEGWQNDLEGFKEWLSENAIFKASGASLTGQIGGATPVSNVGIFVDGISIKLWDSSKSKYVPAYSVPIGSVIDYPCAKSSPPENYLFCEGQLLAIADYSDLFAIIGPIYNKSTDDESTHFRLPNYLGRAAIGAGDSAGEYDPRGDMSGYNTGGPMISRAPGEYWGAEWPVYRVPVPAGSPTPRFSSPMNGVGTSDPPYVWNKNYFNSIVPPSIGVRKIIRYQ